MSYLEKAKQALSTRTAAAVAPRCSRCQELEAVAVLVLSCSCGYATALPKRTAEDRKRLRQALWAGPQHPRGSGQLRLLKGSDSG